MNHPIVKNSCDRNYHSKNLNHSGLGMLVVIDRNVDDISTLVNGVLAGAKVLVLDSATDSIEQITRALAEETFNSLHIVSHGAPGVLYLGNNPLTLDNLNRYSYQLQEWGVPEILLYGCNVAAGDAGSEFIERLHQLTGANIAASATKTGNAARGGNWNLEVQSQEKPYNLAFSQHTIHQYPSTFDDPPVLTTSSTGSYQINGTAQVISPDLTVTDPDSPTLDGAKVSISTNFNSSEDSLGIEGESGTSGTTASGINWSYDANAGVLDLSGTATVADYQAVLRQVTYKNTNTTSAQAQRAFDFNLGTIESISGNQHFNEHFYEFVVSPDITWAQAKDAAESKSHYGRQGYLVTITSAAEQAFVYDNIWAIGPKVWIGASDADNENDWRWETGPEAGTQLNYTNWSGGGLPSDPTKDYAQMLEDGYWDHFQGNDSAGDGYIVEYGGMPGDPNFIISSTVTLNFVANSEPVANNDTGTTNEDTILTVAAPGLLDNDSDPDSDPLTVTGFDPISAKGAIVTVNPDGSYTYDPNGQFESLNNGETDTDTFTYTIDDGNGGTATGIVTVTIDGVIETIEGTTEDDYIEGTPEDEIITGLSGSDFLIGYGGNDIIDGGDGVDLIEAGAGNDIIDGGADDDLMFGDAGHDQMIGSSGIDFFLGGAGEDTADYSNIGEAITFDAQTVVDKGAAGIDEIFEVETIIGALNLANKIDGSTGVNDANSFEVDLTANSLIVDDGVDPQEYTIENFVDVIGTPNNDSVTGNDADNTFLGRGGDDLFIGSLGNDTLDGGAGEDTADYANLDAAITFDAQTQVDKAANGLDEVSSVETIIGALGQANAIDGSTGVNDTNSLIVDLTADSLIVDDGVDPQEYTIENFVDVIGTPNDDSVAGNDADNTFLGMAGADLFIGSIGNDLLDGGGGQDTADYALLDAAITFDAQTEVDKGANGLDEVSLVETIIGALGQANTIDGSTAVNDGNSFSIDLAANSLTVDDGVEPKTYTVVNFVNASGNNQDDELIGNDEDNLLIGHAGSDSLDGQAGADTLIGVDPTSATPGAGERDHMWGGAGADLFVLGDAAQVYYLDDNDPFGRVSQAIIHDFVSGVDKLQLSGVADDYVTKGSFIYADQGSVDGALDPGDDLIAYARGGFDAATDFVYA